MFEEKEQPAIISMLMIKGIDMLSKKNIRIRRATNTKISSDANNIKSHKKYNRPIPNFNGLPILNDAINATSVKTFR